MRGKKGAEHPDPDDPPRRRGNNRPGRPGWAGDRPPVFGVVGREGGGLRLRVERHVDGVTVEKVVGAATAPGAVVHTDESSAYNVVPRLGRSRRSVNHARKEWARDDDGDGVREVHCNTMEGAWVGLRNFLRPFRGVNKVYLAQYAAIFAWGYEVKRATAEFLRALLGVGPATVPRT